MTNVSMSSLFLGKEVRVYLKLAEAIDTPRALTCYLLAKHSEWDQLLDLQVFHDDQNVRHSADDYLITSLLRKNPRLPLGVDTKQVALDKFLECERACADTNRRFLTSRDSLAGATGQMRLTLKRARRIIARILGPLSTRDLEFVWEAARFGNGSTSAVTGTDVSSSRKYAALSGTPRLSHSLKKLIPTLWWEGAGTLAFPVCWFSNVNTVPKHAKTDRPICIEPHNNVHLQLGIGVLLRNKLKRAGLDLRVQADVNRMLASIAQAMELATIDLESASDMIARQLVYALIPARWCHLLEMARTDYTKMPDGTIIRLEKWSSMGNGYTFELESLIFWALALACSENRAFTVAFGDDIIVPQASATDLIATLEYCGFRVNRAKTFLAGAFFESCGTDWLNGTDIRPFFFRSEVNDREDQIDALYKMANQIRLYAQRSASQKDGGGVGCDRRFLGAWLAVRSYLPEHWQKCRIPAGYGDDGGLISNFDEASPSYDRVFGEYRFQRRYRRPVRTGITSLHGYLLSHIRSPQTVSRHKIAGSGIMDFIERDPIVSVTARYNWDGEKALSADKLKIVSEPRCVDLRGVKKKGQLAVGHVSMWPSLGPWV